MASKKDILKKIRVLLTQKFDSPEKAFEFFDKNNDRALNRSEIKTMLKSADISRFLTPMVAEKMLSDLDQSKDDKVEWSEFKKSVKDLMKMS
jgi:Ca2+-binding EF-hand superfamily protein